jgi:RimJ/RimL family protein N-acetyltransferase
MEPNVRLKTDRLILRPWETEDFEVYASMCAEPEVVRFTTIDGKPMSRDAASGAYAYQLGHWLLKGFGQFAVVDRTTSEIIGRAGPWQPESWPDFEVQCVLRRKYWKKGYATEAMKACMAYSFEELNKPHLIGLIEPENIRSMRLAARVGEQFESNVRLPWIPDRPLLQYGIHRRDWVRQGQ